MYDNWEKLEKSIENCNKCKLCKTRQNIVFGVGNKQAKIMFIGEGPGADEDRLRRAICRKSRKANGPSIQNGGDKKGRSIHSKYSKM